MIYMLTEQQLMGIYVPIVTPFLPSGGIDLPSLQHYLKRLPLSDLNGIVVNGTTAESPVISSSELQIICEAVRNEVKAFVLPIVIGTGTNDTIGTMKRTEQAGLLGAEAALVVVPYYSRPSQQGIIEHYRHIAQVGLPIIVYDVPIRTGVKLTVDTLRTIMELEGVIGVKDSTGSIQMVSELSRYDSKPVLCGEDELFYAALCCGAKGGMLASANVETASFVQLYDRFIAGDVTSAKQIFDQLLPLIRLLFAESNPAPLKWLLAQRGEIATDQLRLPMLGISETLQHQLRRFV
jgi:4-hydroxy-tetrahydrodipicolinate synthase